VREIKIVDQEQSSSDIDEPSNEGATSWIKEDKTPKLGPFTGNPGVKQIPCDPTKMSDTMELFFGDSFFKLSCKETKQNYYQNQEKYASRSKELKWVDVSVAEMKTYYDMQSVHNTQKKTSETRYICKFCLVPLRKSQCSQRYHTLKQY
jgi:hypothetical protein